MAGGRGDILRSGEGGVVIGTLLFGSAFYGGNVRFPVRSPPVTSHPRILRATSRQTCELRGRRGGAEP